MSIIDDLKRLERLGDENSKTAEKIRVATRDVAMRIVEQLKDVSDECSLPRGYTIKTLTLKTDDVIERFQRRFLVLEKINGKTGKKIGYIINGLQSGWPEYYIDSDGKQWTLEKTPINICLGFAQDLADGFLAELSEWTERYTKDIETNLNSLSSEGFGE